MDARVRTGALLCALSAAAGCGSDHEAARTSTSPERAPASAPPRSPGPAGSPTATAPTATALRPVAGDRQAVERTVAELADATEQGDGARVCALTGGPAGAGLGALRRCAAAAGFEPTTLPSSDELTIERVHLAGPRATATLAGGARIELRRVRRIWLVERVRVP